jgi:glycerol-3-phosphate dehydrogenase
MRGFNSILVERRDLTNGTSGRYHGLLHSGARYVVKDPLAARECIEENTILRRIMPHCIEDTGGFFVLTPEDDPTYPEHFVAGCQQAGIAVTELEISQMLKEEPLLNPNIIRCFRVPDGAADSFLAARLNADAARQHEAEILTYYEVFKLLFDGDRIAAALCHDLVKDEEVQINADLIVNASGAWAGKLAATAGLTVQMIPGKGTMAAVNHRVVNTVINRCKLPGDGDILVPAHTVAVIGTTDIKVADPDQFGIEPWEIRLMLDEGEKIMPGFKKLRLLRAWAGVRPLFQETTLTTPPIGNRDVTRAFVILDHKQRDDVEGLITITGGKWTTYRKMAEVTVDCVCEKLGVQRSCQTHTEMLPGPGEHVHHYLGARLAEIESAQAYGQLVCECELATYQEVEKAITLGAAKTIDDVRRTVRLGMGPCQGGFCTYRATGLWHSLRHPAIVETNAALHDFLQERWKGVLPILWGQQLRQERLNEYIYLNVLNITRLPGPKGSPLGSQAHTLTTTDAPQSVEEPASPTHLPAQPAALHPSIVGRQSAEVLILGGGLAGLVATWRAAKRGRRARLITKGWGTTHWGAGTIDLIGYYPLERYKPVESPLQAIQQYLGENPNHPYAFVGLEQIKASLDAFQALCQSASYPMHGSLDKTWLIPTAAGAIRPACLIPETMVAGDLHQRNPLLVIGFNQFLDFYPTLITDNLNAQAIFASEMMLELPSLSRRRFVNGMVLARLFETNGFRAEVIEAVRPRLGNATRVGFPAVLGLQNPLQVKQDLEAGLGLPVFEIPGLPPSIPGLRLQRLLVAEIERLGGCIYEGMQITGAQVDGQQIMGVFSDSAVRPALHRAQNYILATGGILGGGLLATQNGELNESIFSLPITPPRERSDWYQARFLADPPHSIFHSGCEIDRSFRPIQPAGRVIYKNLFAVGSALGHCDPIRERSLEGIALATGYAVGEQV